MKTQFLIFLLVVLCKFNVGQVKQCIYQDNQMSWPDAQQYCRQYYTDLYTVNNDSENNMIKAITGDRHTWIGLHRNDLALTTWGWSSVEQSLYFNFQPGQSDDTTKKCVMLTKDGWMNEYCNYQHHVFCEWIFSLFLVKENKTWEEAYEYCRANYTGLASLISDKDLNMAAAYTSQAQSVSVWTGLRFLAGEWIWVNGDSMESLVSLPLCPAQPYRCGALNSKTNIWENRDCEEKLNFLCY